MKLLFIVATCVFAVMAVDPLSPVRKQRRELPQKVVDDAIPAAVIERDGEVFDWPSTDEPDNHHEEPCIDQPKVFFLLMANNSFPHVEVWRRFLASAKQGTDFQFFIHCEDEASCRDRRSLPRDVFKFVKTVRSEWCEDLVNPMIQLLNGALNASCKHDHDRFVFVSSNTVPVKPFKHIHAELTQRDAYSSNLCIQPWDEWGVDVRTGNAVVKHSQWLTLSRKHAKEAAAKWVEPRHAEKSFLEEPSPEPEALGQSNRGRVRKSLTFPRDSNTAFEDMDSVMPMVWSPFPSILPESRAWPKLAAMFGQHPKAQGCLDEFYFFRTLFGDLLGNDGPTKIHGLNGGALELTEETRKSHQGQCDTFAAITDDRSTVRGVFKEDAAKLQADNGTNMTFPMYHAAGFRRLSMFSLGTLKKSSFLFARKLDENTTFAGELTLSEAFDRYVFSN